jgi:hypothetical protein
LGPRSLAIDAKDNLLVVTNEGAGTLVLVSLATNQVAGRINGVETGLDGDDDKDDHTDRGHAANLPKVKTVSPNSAKAGSTFALTITGKNLGGATSVVFAVGDDDGPGKLGAAQADTAITSTNLAVSADGTQLTATVTIAASAAPGARDVRIVTPNGASVADDGAHIAFAVTP